MSIIANLGNIINEKNQSSELWQAQRQADRENTNAMQDAGVLQITSDPETYLRYLNCQADNPSYSAGNVALVMVQDQDATIFGTKDRWKSLMRSVSPTEEKNGVKIYTRSSFGKGYVLTDVYDVRQTSGRDLKHTALQPDSKEMTEALKTLLNYCVVPLVSDESIPMPALYDPNQMKWRSIRNITMQKRSQASQQRSPTSVFMPKAIIRTIRGMIMSWMRRASAI